MELKQLLKGVEIKSFENKKNVNINHITLNSKDVKQGSMFIAIEGENSDGHDYVQEAVAKGAAAVVIAHKLDTNISQPLILVEDSRKAMALIAGNFYENPARRIKMFAITGTNGKTTTTYLLKSILEANGEKVGLIGTNANYIGSTRLPPTLTTPDPLDLHKLLLNMLDCSVTSVVMEASAHAIFYNKLAGIKFNGVAFTNLSKDHLDFFKTMENYKDAKKAIFTKEYTSLAVVNYNDIVGKELYLMPQVLTYNYGIENNAEIRAENIELSPKGTKFELNIFDNKVDIDLNLIGKFNVENALAAASLAFCSNVPIAAIKRGLNNAEPVSGRFNRVDVGKDYDIIVDYAHTSDGIYNVLKTLREITKNKIITVFGCGGNRDKTKRPEMGKVATDFSDFCFITSDNPRFENPDEIISDITTGIKGNTNYSCITNRKEAIEVALDMADEGDVVVILGKGAEPYMDINGIKEEYSDFKVIEDYYKTEKQNIKPQKISDEP